MTTQSQGAQGERVEQIAFVVPDIDAAMSHHAAMFGSGPYFLNHIVDGDCIYRGAPSKLNVKFALGQWGDVQLEFIENVDDAPSLFRELNVADSPRSVFHHVCLLPASLSESISSFAAQGFPVVSDMTTPVGTRIVMVDTVDRYGHFVELHERSPHVDRVYANIRRASEEFDGERLVRPFSEAFA
jgi:hypothetical protein